MQEINKQATISMNDWFNNNTPDSAPRAGVDELELEITRIKRETPNLWQPHNKQGS
jgi:hypothetical protein